MITKPVFQTSFNENMTYYPSIEASFLLMPLNLINPFFRGCPDVKLPWQCLFEFGNLEDPEMAKDITL